VFHNSFIITIEKSINEKTFLRYGEKGFCISNTFIQVTTSPLINDQKKHDEYENSINALRSHNVIISATKIQQEFETSNSLEEKIVIFIQIVRNSVDFKRENHNSIHFEQFQYSGVI